MEHTPQFFWIGDGGAGSTQRPPMRRIGPGGIAEWHGSIDEKYKSAPNNLPWRRLLALAEATADIFRLQVRIWQDEV